MPLLEELEVGNIHREVLSVAEEGAWCLSDGADMPKSCGTDSQSKGEVAFGLASTVKMFQT